MPNPYDLEVIAYVIPQPATVPPGTVTAPDWTALQGRVTTLEEGQALDDLTDVTTAGATDGQTIVFDAATSTWAPGTTTGAIQYVKDGHTTVIVTSADRLNFDAGISVTQNGSIATQADINVIYAGTGSADSAARSDHSHSAEVGAILTGTATGVLSSGTRSLSTATLGVLSSGIVYDLEAEAVVRCRNNVNSGTANLLLRIGTDASYPERSRNVQTVGGVPVDQIIKFRGVFTGAGSGLPLSWRIQFSTGDAVDVRDWELSYAFRPRR